MEGCFEDELVLAFVEGRLSDSAADAADGHIGDCTQCRQLVLAAARAAKAHGDHTDDASRSDTHVFGDLAVAVVAPLARGTTVGRYLIVDVIGRGGMGVVYAAYDPELDRRVALKLLRPELAARDGSEGAARLLREGRAIARLAHPNVVTVFDVGTYDGGVFVAMEFVAGKSLAEWLATERTWSEVIAVFRQAGAGLAAAHAAGLVHRDFKPANVLIGNDGRVRVGDFGLARRSDDVQHARAVSEPGANADISLTRTGAMVGTPAYMAPEQLAGGTADARSDQFSFAVALFEALHGVRPFAGTNSIELATAIAAQSIAGERTSVPQWLRSTVTRGLAVDPKTRHSSLDSFVRGLDPPRGHARLYIATAALAFLIAMIVIVGTRRDESRACVGVDRGLVAVWDVTKREQVERAFVATAQPHARESFALAARRLDTYAASWATMRLEACEATQVRREQTEAHQGLRMLCLDDRLAELRALVVLLAAPDEAVVRNAVLAVDKLVPVSTCANLRLLTARIPPPADAATHARLESLAGRLATAQALGQAGKYRLARDTARDVVTEAKQIGYRPLIARALLLAGQLADRDGDGKHAEQQLTEAVWAAEAGHDDRTAAQAWIALARVVALGLGRTDEGSKLAGHADAAVVRLGDDELERARLEISRGAGHEKNGKYREALAEYERSLATRRRLLPEDDLEVAEALAQVANALGKLGRYAESKQAQQSALATRVRALGEHHPDVAGSLVELGTAALNLGDVDAAEAAHRQSLAIREAALGSEHPDVANSLVNLAAVLRQRQLYDDAFALCVRALAIATKRLGAQHPDVADYHYQLGVMYIFLKKPDDARRQLELGLAVLEQARGGDHPGVALLLGALSQVNAGQGRFEVALANARRALAIETQALGADHPQLARRWQTLAQVHQYAGTFDEAVAGYQKALALQEKTLGAEHREIASTTSNLTESLAKLGKLDEAVRFAERTVAIREKSLGTTAPRLARDLVALGKLYRAAERHDDAIRVLERTLALPASQLEAQRIQDASYVLAMELWDTRRDRARARSLATAARAELETLGHRELAAEVARWLVAHP